MSSFVILWHVVGQLCWFEAGSGGGGLIFNDWSDQAGHQATNHHSDDEDDNGDDEDNYGGPDQVKKTLKKLTSPKINFLSDPSPIIALPCPTLSHWPLLIFVQSVGFVKVDTWISLDCYMDLSKLVQLFDKVVTWICQSCSLFILPFAEQNQAEV